MDPRYPIGKFDFQDATPLADAIETMTRRCLASCRRPSRG